MANWIHDIEINNFKSIRHARVEDCQRINLFVGPPNVGKSNLIEALSLLSYVNSDFHTHLRRMCRYELFSDLFNYGNVSESSNIEFNSNNRISLQYQSEASLHLELQRKHKKKIINWECLFGLEINKDDQFVSLPEASRKDLLLSQEESLQKLKVFKYKFEIHLFDKVISAIHLDSPAGENLFEVIQKSSEVKKAFAELIKPFGFKMLFDTLSKKLRLFKELDDATIASIPFGQIADTLQMLIFHLAGCLTNKDSVVLFEEPEAHLYEPYILELTNQLKYDKQHNQFFVVTHSQYVIDELLRDDESRYATNIYLVGIEGDSTKVKLLVPKKNKDVFERGLNVFFNYQNLWEEN